MNKVFVIFVISIFLSNCSLNENSIKPLQIEGQENLKWVLIDYANIVINIFDKETREFYSIERLWGDAKVEKIKESYEA